MHKEKAQIMRSQNPSTGYTQDVTSFKEENDGLKVYMYKCVCVCVCVCNTLDICGVYMFARMFM